MFDGVALGDEFVEFQSSTAVECNQPRKVLARSRRAIHAAGEGFFLKAQAGGAHAGGVCLRRHTDRHGSSAFAQAGVGLCDEPAQTTLEPASTRAVLKAAPTPVITPQPENTESGWLSVSKLRTLPSDSVIKVLAA